MNKPRLLLMSALMSVSVVSLPVAAHGGGTDADKCANTQARLINKFRNCTIRALVKSAGGHGGDAASLIQTCEALFNTLFPNDAACPLTPAEGQTIAANFSARVVCKFNYFVHQDSTCFP